MLKRRGRLMFLAAGRGLASTFGCHLTAISTTYRRSWHQDSFISMMSSKAFPNPYPDYNGERLFEENEKMLQEGFRQKLKGSLSSLLPQLESGLQLPQREDYSVYTGHTGIALLYLHLYHSLPDSPERQSYLETSVGYLRQALTHVHPQNDVFTFLCGDAGILAVAAVAFAELGDKRTSQECVSRLQGLDEAVVKGSNVPDEHLYGRAGYLAAVMFVQSHLGNDVIHKDTTRKVVRAMLASGRAMSQKKQWKPPLMYAWYKEYYLGAAHGLAGIMYTLLLTQKDPELCVELDKWLPPTLDYLLTLQFPSGNFPAVIGEQDDRLVHWCHGAPGWASLWAVAYQTYKESRYLEAAERCGDVCWERGLLKKGYGLCHGAAGNAYAFLALFRLTHNQKHLYRACKFAEWCFDYGKHGCRIADTPFSLFEGMAGTVYFLADLLDPLKARFPAYEF